MDMTIALISSSVGFEDSLLLSDKLKHATATAAVPHAFLQTANLP